MADIKVQSMENKEALEFFRNKVNLPTQKWDDLKGTMHTRAFTVAGAMKEDLLCDFKTSIEKALTDGKTIVQFRRDFDRIVEKHGWQYNGERKWRSDLIYSTNVHSAYAEAREQQMHDKDMAGIFTHARYRSMNDGRDRPEHHQWNNTILPMNDPWWNAHTPPNGWGCRCWKEPVSIAEAESKGLSVSKSAPTPSNDTKGIDKGWDYNIGDSTKGNAWVQQFATQQERKLSWSEITDQKGLWSTTGESIDLPPIKDEKYFNDKRLSNEAEFVKVLSNQLGGNIIPVDIQGNEGFSYHGVVDVKSLVNHLVFKNGKLDMDRSKFSSMFAKTILDPAEIRMVFLESESKKTAIRSVFYNNFTDGKTSKYVAVVFDAQKGQFAAHTSYSMRSKPKVEGTLIYQKKHLKR